MSEPSITVYRGRLFNVNVDPWEDHAWVEREEVPTKFRSTTHAESFALDQARAMRIREGGGRIFDISSYHYTKLVLVGGTVYCWYWGTISR